MSQETEFKGTITALATPFDPSGQEIDYASLDKLIDFQIDSDVDGVVACGSTAEAASLTDDEYKNLIKYIAEKCKGKIFCIGGVITNNTKKACEMAAYMTSQKLDGVLLVTPPYIKPTQEGIIEHFRAVKSACKLPLIAYNIPGRSACMITAETIARLVDEDLISAIKDSTGSIDHMLEVVSLTGDRLDILSGEDSLVYPVMACGGKGVISASANVLAKQFVEITSSALRGDMKKSLAAQIGILNIVKTMFMETNPIPVKAALQQIGIFKSSKVRVPLTNARPETIEKIKSLLSSIQS